MAYKPRGKSFTSETAKEAVAMRKTHAGGKRTTLDEDLEEERSAVGNAVDHAMYWMGWPQIKTDDECLERIRLFFDRCRETEELPTIEKLATALGIHRQTLNNWEHGSMGPGRMVMVQQAKTMIAAIDSELVGTGKMPAVPWIFRAKNFYGMTDVQEIHVENTNVLGDVVDQKTLAQKYVDALPMID